ncbi:MAG: acyltransferase [Candidatus Binatia bacterium]
MSGTNSEVRSALKAAAFWIATVLVAPLLLSWWMRSYFLGRDRALESSAQLLALLPGLPGQYLRRAFLARTLAAFHPSATIEFGTLFSKCDARIGENVYVGPRCHLGSVDLEADVLLAAGVHVPSGPRIHGTEDISRPIREQPGELRTVRIGRGAWIGSAAVVMADVGRDSIVGAGAVVTNPIPERVVAGGVPARVLRNRSEAAPAGRANDLQGSCRSE